MAQGNLALSDLVDRMLLKQPCFEAILVNEFDAAPAKAGPDKLLSLLILEANSAQSSILLSKPVYILGLQDL